MMVTEAYKRRQRKVEHLPLRYGPYRRRHRQKVPLAERRRIVAGFEGLADRHVVDTALQMHRRRLAVEAQQVAEHAPELRSKHVGGLRKQRPDAGSRPLDARRVIAYRKRHRTGCRGDAKLIEQRDKLLIRPVVVDQKARIYWSVDAVE